MHIKKLDDSEKVKLSPNQIWGKGSGAGIVAISESGLYKLTMCSDRTEAKPFQDWGTKEVLPSIRKDIEGAP